MTSPIIRSALDQWRTLRLEFEDVRAAAYDRAVDATNGHLLNRRGRDAGIDAYDLFIGSDVKAYAYASDELKDHWTNYPRMSFAAYERQRYEQEPS